MSKLPLLLIVLVTLVGEFLAQPPIAEWNEVQSIELLKSNRSEVGALLKKESLESVLSGYSEYFYTPNSVIRVRYSKGTCNGDTEDWNVPQGIVTEVEITLKDDIQISKIGIDLSKYRKERTDWQRKNIYVLTDKPTGIAVSVFASRVDSIYLFPSAKNYQRLCDKPALKEYYARKRWLRDPKSKKMIIDYNSPANVVDVGIEQTKQDEKHFSIFTKAEDPENDVLTFFYRPTAGKIIGTGPNVIWDLSGVKPGTYSITVAVNDGCGLCGKFVTKTVVIH